MVRPRAAGRGGTVDEAMRGDPGPLLVERRNSGVTLLTLNRPDRRNAMTEEMTAAWSEAMDDLAQDRTVRAVVLTGEGTAFCSGGDLSWISEGDASPDRLRDRMMPFYRTWLAVRDLPMPVFAALNGPAVGAGLCLALACDVRVAGPAARLSAPFLHLGMHSGMAATWLLEQTVGLARTRELLYTGRALDADEALAWGLVSRVAPDPLAAALELAERTAAAAPLAVRLTKAGLARPGRSFEEALEWEALAQPVTLATNDIHKGVQARRERRNPSFEGN